MSINTEGKLQKGPREMMESMLFMKEQGQLEVSPAFYGIAVQALREYLKRLDAFYARLDVFYSPTRDPRPSEGRGNFWSSPVVHTMVNNLSTYQ
ncbi:unnamed protein product [Coccothraustes coccothraustes]